MLRRFKDWTLAVLCWALAAITVWFVAQSFLGAVR